MEPHFAYTVSSVRDLVQQLTISIESLQNFVPKDNIHVFVTPPIEEEDLDHIRNLAADVRSVDHYADPVPKGPRSDPLYYTDKLHVCKLNVEKLVLLDTDTIVLSDPKKLFDGSEFRARPGGLDYSPEKWRQFGEENNGILSWLPNAGVVVFDDYLQCRIEDEWAEALKMKNKVNDSWTEQHALAVAASDAETSKLSESEHSMMWKEEKTVDGVVYHYNDQWNTTGPLDIAKGVMRKALRRF